MTLATDAQEPKMRRTPQQHRSRDRVERILEAAGSLVVEFGVGGLGTRAIAERAAVPISSVYQYFADKDEILLALVERDMAEMDAQVSADLAELEVLSMPAIIATTMWAFVKVYRLRPTFVMLWMRGRTNQAISDYGRAHNERISDGLFDLAVTAGLVLESAKPLNALLAVEAGDRMFQLAFETDINGAQNIIDESIEMVTSYVNRFASEAGLVGIPR